MSAQEIPNFTRVVADSDFDGLCGAAILKKFNPSAEIIFSHAALIRNGAIDNEINKNTVIVDLPFHPNCGWYLDHHQTNKPSNEELIEFEQNGGVIDWQPTPSAARLAYERIKDHICHWLQRHGLCHARRQNGESESKKRLGGSRTHS